VNYLAHFYLAEATKASLLGAILGDFVKGRLVAQFEEAILEGIRLHRSVDAYTDSHTIPAKSRALFPKKYRRYAGVVMDVTYDHFLAKNWSSYSSISLREFSATVYQVLKEYDHILPYRLQQTAPRMAAQDWLAGYAEKEGLFLTLAGLGRRVKRDNPLQESYGVVMENYEELELHFKAFVPEVLDFATKHHQSTERNFPEWRLLSGSD